MAAQTEVQLHAVISAVPPPYLAESFQDLTIVSFAASSTVLKTMHGFSDGQYGAISLLQVTAVLGVLTGRGLAKRFGLKMLLSAVLLVNALYTVSRCSCKIPISRCSPTKSRGK